jgi:hypothetical protein
MNRTTRRLVAGLLLVGAPGLSAGTERLRKRIERRLGVDRRCAER